MEPYDIIMLAILGLSVLFGFLKGFAWQIATVAAFTVSYFVSARFYQPISDKFSFNPLVTMFGLFIGTSLIIWIVYGMIHKQIEKMQLKSFDRQIGAVVGLGTGVAVCLIVTFFAVTMFGEAMGKKVVKSTSGKYIAQVIQKMDGIFPEKLQDKVDPYLNRLDDELESAKSAPPSEDDDRSIGEIIQDPDAEFIRGIEEALKNN